MQNTDLSWVLSWLILDKPKPQAKEATFHWMRTSQVICKIPWSCTTAGCCFCFGSIPLFFLELFLHWSPVPYWAPYDLRSSSFSVLSFCLFILFMGFSKQEYWSGLPFPSTVDHILSDLSTMTLPSWVAPHGIVYTPYIILKSFKDINANMYLAFYFKFDSIPVWVYDENLT